MTRNRKIPARFYPEATKLAALPYPAVAIPDGDYYMAYDTVLKVPKGQGSTAQEALADLSSARIDYIAFLLMEGEPVPTP